MSSFKGKYCEKHNYNANKENILKIAKDTLSEISYDYDKSVKNIKLDKLEFSNLFSYGDNNVIDFNLMTNTIGICEKNGSGKTSLINSLLFSIFGKIEETSICLINKKSERKEATSKISLYVNSDHYIIDRTIFEGKKQDLVKVKKNGVCATCGGKNNTEEYIKENICDIDDMINLNIILQRGNNFLDLKDTNRKRMIENNFNMSIIDLLISAVGKKISATKTIIKDIEKHYDKNDIKKIKDGLSNNKKAIEHLERDGEIMYNYIINIEKEISNINGKLSCTNNDIGNNLNEIFDMEANK